MCYSALAPLVHVAMVAEEPEALELAVEYERCVDICLDCVSCLPMTYLEKERY